MSCKNKIQGSKLSGTYDDLALPWDGQTNNNKKGSTVAVQSDFQNLGSNPNGASLSITDLIERNLIFGLTIPFNKDIF